MSFFDKQFRRELFTKKNKSKERKQKGITNLTFVDTFKVLTPQIKLSKTCHQVMYMTYHRDIEDSPDLNV